MTTDDDTPELADDGFTLAVMARVAQQRRLRARVLAAATLAAAAIAGVALSWTDAPAQLAVGVSDIALGFGLLAMCCVIWIIGDHQTTILRHSTADSDR